MKTKVAVCILTYNRINIVKDYLPKICEKVTGDSEILIWDNASTDGTQQWLRTYCARNSHVKTTLFQNGKKNYGVEAINFLAEYANSEYILKVDSDIRVPNNFVENIVGAFEEVNNPKLIFLAYDMAWGGKTFATRWGLHMYKPPAGEIVKIKSGKVLITHNPSKWLVNGACRLSKRKDFLLQGKHPRGAIYGVDTAVSRKVAKLGRYIGYYSTSENIVHCPVPDSKEYRAMKTGQLKMNKGRVNP